MKKWEGFKLQKMEKLFCNNHKLQINPNLIQIIMNTNLLNLFAKLANFFDLKLHIVILIIRK